MKRFLLLPLLRFLGRRPALAMSLALVYLLLPFDAAPEGLLGPFGLADDLLVLALPFIAREYVRRLQVRQAERKRRRPDVIDTTLADD